jgi:hypothetical protein
VPFGAIPALEKWAAQQEVKYRMETTLITTQAQYLENNP